jgi:hypothetical protein
MWKVFSDDSSVGYHITDLLDVAGERITETIGKMCT